MILFPNTKINIGLQIKGKRPDGYHELNSIFYPLKFGDILEVCKSERAELKQTGIKIEVDLNENLVWKAYELMKKEFAISPIFMHLHKIVPTGAGLGGGSADASFLIKGVSDLFNLNLSYSKMEELSSRLGSDCPFFIRNKPSFVSGRGEQLEEIKFDLPGKYLILIHPGIHVSTKEAFSKVNYSRDEMNLKDIGSISTNEWSEKIANGFEESVFANSSEIGKIKDTLKNLGAIYSSMTGSGSAVYGFFENLPELNVFDNKGWFVHYEKI